jgi:HEAT repeats/Tetratricopeptide repeat
MSRVITAAVVASLVFAGHAASAQPVPIPVLPPVPVLPQTFVLPPVPPLPVLPEMPTLPELPPMPPVPVAPLSPMPPMPPLAALPPLPPGPYFDFNDFDAGFLYQPAPKPQPAPRPEPPPRTGRVVIERNAEGAYEQARQLIDSGRYERALESLDRVAAAPNSTRADAALYWKAYAQWKLDQRADALATLADMGKRFPQSRWAKDAQALDVEIRQRSGDKVSPDGQSSEELKLLALRGLMNSDPDRAIPMIEQILAGPSTVRVKENALFVLSQSRSARARDIIAGAAKGNLNPDLQLRAIRYLGAIGGPENRQVLDDAYRATTDVAVKRAIIRSFNAAGDRQRVLALAKSETAPELRGEAARSLGAMNATAELDELYQRETSPEVKNQIIRGMMSSGNVGSLTKLATSEKDPALRRTAIRNLGAMGSSKTSETLRSIYASDSNADVKMEVIDALMIQQNAPLLVTLARAEKDAALKRRIVERLSTMKSKEATDYMLELLK